MTDPAREPEWHKTPGGRIRWRDLTDEEAANVVDVFTIEEMNTDD